MNRPLTPKILICLGLVALVLLGMPTAPPMAQGPLTGPVQLALPPASDPSAAFAGVGAAAGLNPLGGAQLLGNPGFENGNWLPWETYGAPTLDGSIRHGGSKSARLGNANNAGDQIVQTVTVPGNASQVAVGFWYRLETSETAAGVDFLCYGLWTQDGVTSLAERCMDLGALGRRDWSQDVLSLTESERAGVAGQTVLLAFVIQTNAAQPSRVWIDDTALNVGASTGRKLHLPLITKALPTVPSPPPPSGETGAFWLPSIGGNSIRTTYGTSVAVDSAGGMHVGYALYSGLDNGQRPAYYAYCAANCARPANWSLTRLGSDVQDVRLALDPRTGRPRMLLYTNDLADTYRYQYAACEGGCTNSANWTITVLVTNSEIPATRSQHNNRYFALDPQGGPGFIYTDSDGDHAGTFYAHCNSGCTNAGNWSELKLFDQGLIRPALAFGRDGQLHLAASYYVADDPVYEGVTWKLLYARCDSNCDNLPLSHWGATFVAPMIGDGSFSLRVDTGGRPRMALYPTSTDLAQMEPGQLYYLWCDSATCLNVGDWNKASVGTPFAQGEGVDLALDAANRPRLAFQMGGTGRDAEGGEGLGYAWCDANCGATASWQARSLESSATVMALYPPGLPTHQSCPILTWLNGVRPSLALDAAGSPRVGYDAELWWGGTSPYIQCDIAVPVARLGLFNK